MEIKISTQIKDFISLVEKAEKDYNYYYEQVGIQDKLSQDILHKLELEDLEDDELNETAVMLQTNRKDRRYYKDRIEELKPLYDFYMDNKEAINKLKNTLGATRKAEGYHAHRTYKPRVLKTDKDTKETDK
jgi:hypothetical protein